MQTVRKWIKTACCLVVAGSALATKVIAQSPVTVTIDAGAPGRAIPDDFAGVSIFTGTQAEGHRGMAGNLFSGTNFELITLFKNSGLHHVRLGATGSPNSDVKNLDHHDIDSLFAFAQATGIKVIYSLHYADGVPTAQYVWQHYRPYLDYFAFDNEPDGRLKESGAGKNNYFDSWKAFAKSVVEAVPGVKFAGPDAAGRTLVPRFVKEEKDCGCLGLVTQHTYVGGNPRKKGIDTVHGVQKMLSKEWVTENYPQLYRGVLRPVAKEGLPFRITELDDYVHGVTNGSDAFASALWALDALHWWAERDGAAGVNFQNTEWLTTDTFHPDAAGHYQINPKAYGIRAFELGGHGQVEPVTLENTNGLNLTAYAVGSRSNLFVTIINKEYGQGARDAVVRIQVKEFPSSGATAMFLRAPDGNVFATNGVTLGGAFITNNAIWNGQWESVTRIGDTKYQITVPAASAVVIKITGP